MVPECKTCKHWAPGEQPWGVQIGQKVGFCNAVRGYGSESKPGMLAVAVGESVYGELMTDENFGCILHKYGERNVYVESVG